MDVSHRLQNMAFSPIRKLNSYEDIARKKGVKVYHLNIGQPDIETPKEFFEGIKNYKDSVLKYCNSQGVNELIESFIKYYKNLDFEFYKNELMITNGGSEAVYFALMATCDLGDNVLVPEPYYTNYNSFFSLAGVNINAFETKAEEGFHLPQKNAIVSKINERTKAILISNPGNPTGVVYTKDELRLLADIAKENDLFLISDEVYREFVYDDLKFTSALSMEDLLPRLIIVDSISKRYSACGARIGMIASKNNTLMNEVLKLCQSRLSSPTIEQYAAANLINTPKEYFEKVKIEYENRRNILYEALINMPGVVCRKPTGAFYIVVKLPVKDAEEFAKWLLTDYSHNDKTVMVAPAAGFYSTPELGINEVRISYCINIEELKDAMTVFAKGLEHYRSLNK